MAFNAHRRPLHESFQNPGAEILNLESGDPDSQESSIEIFLEQKNHIWRLIKKMDKKHHPWGCLIGANPSIGLRFGTKNEPKAAARLGFFNIRNLNNSVFFRRA